MKLIKALFLILLIGAALLVINSIFSVTMARIYFGRIERDGRYLKVEQEEVFFKVIGDGDPVLMIHGFAGSHFDFLELAKLLSSNRRVYLLDLPGFGLSTASNKGDYSRKGYAELVVDLMSLLNIEKADLIGHSFGGEVSLNIAYYFPERVNRLVLIDSSIHGDRDILPGFFAQSKIMTRIAMRFYFQTFPVQRLLYTKGLGDKSLFSSETFGRYFSLVDHMSSSFIYEFINSDDTASISDKLGEIECSTLILWGENDIILPVAEHGEPLAKKIPNSILKVVEGSGHAPFLESPERIAKEIIGFLE